MADRFLLQPFRHGASTEVAGRRLFNGLALTADPDRHLRDKILAVLFTAPGERVNQPRFGVGLNRAVFESLDELTVAAVEFRISEGLRRDLGGEIEVEDVSVTAQPTAGEMVLSIRYRRRNDRLPRNLEIEL